MEWDLLCDYYQGMILALEAVGYQREEPLSQFWRKDNSWAHLTLSGIDGVKLTVDGKCKVMLPRHLSGI